MTKHESHKSQQPPTPWSDLLTTQALASLPENTSIAEKAAAMQELGAKLPPQKKESVRRDPKHFDSFTVKYKYEQITAIPDKNSPINHLHIPSDGRILRGNDDGTVRIWSKWKSGSWSSVALKGHNNNVYYLQALPNGRTVSGRKDHTIRIWSQGSGPTWNREVLTGLKEHEDLLRSPQALSDGRIVSGSADNTIRIWDGDEISEGAP